MVDEVKTKRVVARLNSDNIVLELIEEVKNLEDEWHPDFLKLCVDITNHQTRPEVGWQRKGNGQFAAVEEPEWPPLQKSRSALFAGLKVKGVLYHAMGDRWREMRDEAMYVSTFGEFSTGDKLVWQPKEGDQVEFTSTDDFMKVVKNLSRLVAKWQRFGSEQEKHEPEKEVDLD